MCHCMSNEGGNLVFVFQEVHEVFSHASMSPHDWVIHLQICKVNECFSAVIFSVYALKNLMPV